MKSFLNMVTASLLCATACTSPLEAGQTGENKAFAPEEIFEEHDGEKTTRSSVATGANILHNSGIEGQLKDKKRLVIAIISTNFFPTYTELLAKEQKGLLHPSAMREHLIFTPKDLELLPFDKDELNNEIERRFGNEEAALEEEEKKILNDASLSDLERKLKLEKLNQKVELFCQDILNFTYNKEMLASGVLANEVFQDGNAHGSAVMEAIHLVAPKAQLLPIDMWAMHPETIMKRFRTDIKFSLLNAFGVLADKSIDKAIELGADVIYLDRVVDRAQFKAMERASKKDIPIIMPAGNASSKNHPVTLNEPFEVSVKDEEEEKIKNLRQQAFHALKGDGIQFVGALKYSKTAGEGKTIGGEKLTEYTQHPTESTKKNFLFAAGHEIPVHSRVKRKHVYSLVKTAQTEEDGSVIYKHELGDTISLRPNPERIASGTELAAAAVTAGYALLKQIVLENNYKISPKELLNLMYDSARDVEFSSKTMTAVYKSLDLANAKKKLEEMMKPAGASKRAQKVVSRFGTKITPEPTKPVQKVVSRFGTKVAPEPVQVPTPLRTLPPKPANVAPAPFVAPVQPKATPIEKPVVESPLAAQPTNVAPAPTRTLPPKPANVAPAPFVAPVQPKATPIEKPVVESPLAAQPTNVAPAPTRTLPPKPANVAPAPFVAPVQPKATPIEKPVVESPLAAQPTNVAPAPTRTLPPKPANVAPAPFVAPVQPKVTPIEKPASTPTHQTKVAEARSVFEKNNNVPENKPRANGAVNNTTGTKPKTQPSWKK